MAWGGGVRSGVPWSKGQPTVGSWIRSHRVTAEIVACRACPRLVAWREQVAAEKRAAYADEDYWGRPVPGFGDPDAAVLVVGLAPAAHGGNRTGRVFTGDRSGDWLFRSMYRAGLANQPTSTHRDDGLVLHGAYIAAAVRCAPPANKPTVDERDRCRPFLERELALLADVRVVVCLGAFAYERVAPLLGVRPRPRFGHGVEVTSRPAGRTLAVLVPPEPAEHLHRQAHRADARRACSPGRPRWPGSGQTPVLSAARAASATATLPSGMNVAEREEGVHLAVVPMQRRGDAFGLELRRVGLALVAKGVELGRDHQRRRQPGPVGVVERREAHLAAVGAGARRGSAR